MSFDSRRVLYLLNPNPVFDLQVCSKTFAISICTSLEQVYLQLINNGSYVRTNVDLERSLTLLNKNLSH